MDQEKSFENTQEKIKKVTNSIQEVLLTKNKKYGNSALKPINIFCKLDATNGIAQRIDDKLMRVKNSKELRKNDVFDLIGYLTLLCVEKDWDDFSELID